MDEQDHRRYLLDQPKFLVPQQAFMALRHLLVFFQVQELFESSQVLIKFTFDLALGIRKLELVSIIDLGEWEVPVDFVDRLLNESGAFLAHNVEKVEFKMSLICLLDFVDKVSLDELADSFVFAKIKIDWGLLDDKNIY